ncbi:fla cluster protein flaF [Halalkalicoccus tibetensis]|uniref:Fla cluster protein flaF n=1 Tax=Halalkalicoccus tibetensis TaxID=175632 RepID=A0ABD5V6G9_9EURY
MGFSVSGSTVIILIGCLIAFSAAFTVTVDSFDRVTTAQDEHADRLLDRQNTEIEIGDVQRDDATLTVHVTNTGSTALSIDRTDLLIDGGYTHAEHTITNGDTTTDDTDLWLPGDTLAFEAESGGDSVKVVTQHGVAATADVPDADTTEAT